MRDFFDVGHDGENTRLSHFEALGSPVFFLLVPFLRITFYRLLF